MDKELTLCYQNIKTKSILISADGGDTLINSIGATVPFNERAYIEIDLDITKLSDKQKELL